MAVGTITVQIRVKHLWLLKLINYPLVLAGFEPRVPRSCITIEVIHNAP